MGLYAAILQEFITRMTYHTGKGSVTAASGSDLFTATAHGILDLTPIVLSGTTAPAPLVLGTTYYVRDATANTFKLALTAGGAAVNLTTDGENLFFYVTGRILDGLKFYDKPVEKVDGLTDFPFSMFFIPSITEAYHVGARGGSIGGGSMSINLLVRTAREKGLPELLSWVEKVTDALETKRDGSGQIDTNVGGTTMPFTVNLSSSFVLDLSLTAQITVVVQPKPMHRGSRRNST